MERSLPGLLGGLSTFLSRPSGLVARFPGFDAGLLAGLLNFAARCFAFAPRFFLLLRSSLRVALLRKDQGGNEGENEEQFRGWNSHRGIRASHRYKDTSFRGGERCAIKASSSSIRIFQSADTSSGVALPAGRWARIWSIPAS